MEDNPQIKCPAEVHGTDIAARVLLEIYGSQEGCAHTHGCARASCAIDKHWARPGDPAGRGMDPSLVGFILLGLDGPRERGSTGPDQPDTPAAEGRGEDGGPFHR
jgi:hypothetical protein